MSEEILKALTQLFAIVSKQDDGVTDRERDFVIRFFQQELDHDSIRDYVDYFDQISGYGRLELHDAAQKLTSVKDSVRTLGICRKINKTLTRKQKIIVLIRLLEMVGSGENFTTQAIQIIATAANVFNIDTEDYVLIESFVKFNGTGEIDSSDIRVIPSSEGTHHNCSTTGRLVFLAMRKESIYFVKYTGQESNVLNGTPMLPRRVYLFSHGSSVKTTSGDAVYYSDLVANFNKDIHASRISFQADIREFRFANGATGLKNITISEGPGKLIGIMGASGAGKTTLLNVLAGLEKPHEGQILINGLDIHTQQEKIRGVIGYVAQDDLLIEELTVYQNLYFNAKLCFADHTDEQLHERVMAVLANLGLEHRKDLRVGNALEKTISGGQRKRLNIALELIREPAILFLDEPTSGLSSRDSENVIDLLKELSLKGKLIFLVIHQPSSDIYKMFDKMIIMDTGGFPIYYNSPVDAITYFKKATHQADSNRGQCHTCGNVNPEQIFNIIEAKVVDEYGQATTRRKVTPRQWNEMFATSFKIIPTAPVTEEPKSSLRVPGSWKQTIIFATRDLMAKLSNKQYLLINLLEAPLLAAMLALIIRYRNSGDHYLFRLNDNIPAYILMSIIVSLFMGLTVSAEEIIRDRRILKRESFLNLSWNSYLQSKVIILFSLSAIQTLMFVIVGHAILDIRDMSFAFWTMLFSTSCFANILGLNISSAFNSAVTVYIIIPLLLIPQIILSGTLFSFDKLNERITTKGKVPLVADMMVSRWAYEGMAVHQFCENEFQKYFFEDEREKSNADFKASYLADELGKRIQSVIDTWGSRNESTVRANNENLMIVKNALSAEPFKSPLENTDLGRALSPEGFTPKGGLQILHYLTTYKRHYQQTYNHHQAIQEKKVTYLETHGWDLHDYKNGHFNESLSNLVRNVNSLERVSEHEGRIVRLVDPIFQRADCSDALNYRTAFFASEKNMLGRPVKTFTFNLLAIWLMSAVLYAALYTEVMKRMINMISTIGAAFIKKKITHKQTTI